MFLFCPAQIFFFFWTESRRICRLTLQFRIWLIIIIIYMTFRDYKIAHHSLKHFNNKFRTIYFILTVKRAAIFRRTTSPFPQINRLCLTMSLSSSSCCPRTCIFPSVRTSWNLTRRNFFYFIFTRVIDDCGRMTEFSQFMRQLPSFITKTLEKNSNARAVSSLLVRYQKIKTNKY